MWSFRKTAGAPTEKVSAAANVLTGASEAAAPILLEALVGKDAAAGKQQEVAPLRLEMLAFGLHLTDRLAFARLGAHGRSEFMDKLLPVAQANLGSQIGPHLGQLYNSRNVFYGGFAKLHADGKD